MAAKQVKTVSISKSVQKIKADTGTCEQVILGKGSTAVKKCKGQAANKARMVQEMAVAPIEDKDTELVFLLGKYTVEAHFLADIDRKFCEIYSSLVDDVSYTPAEIVGEMFWANLTAMGKRLAILCLKHLATGPDVPLVDLNCTNCGITSFAVA